jgi:hypothetical protein
MTPSSAAAAAAASASYVNQMPRVRGPTQMSSTCKEISPSQIILIV